jgi:hypothetical protein
MERDNDLFFRLGIAPFLMAAFAPHQEKTMAPEDPNDLVGLEAWIFGAQF